MKLLLVVALLPVLAQFLSAQERPSQHAWQVPAVAARASSGAENHAASTSGASQTPENAETLGIAFVEGSTTTLIVERQGKRYVVDLVNRSVRAAEAAETTSSDAPESASSAGSRQGSAQKEAPAPGKRRVYSAGDDVLFTLPTGRPTERHGVYFNFTHRFPFESAFKDRARGATLVGLDDFSVSSFGVRYGLTRRLSVAAFRSPGLIGRPIELRAAYTISDESSGAPLNTLVRFSVDGQNNFSRNFTTSLELILSRSLASRAQFYLVPTLSLHNRPLIAGSPLDPPPLQPCAQKHANGLFGPFSNVRPCADTFALGSGLAVDIRPTLTLLAEAQPVLINGPELGIHRAAFAFGIQKRLWRHAFTLGFTNSPGTTVAQRVGTRATFLGQPGLDTPARVFVGFDVTRQVR